MNQGERRPPLRVALVQFKPRKAKVTANLESIRGIVASQAPVADLVI